MNEFRFPFDKEFIPETEYIRYFFEGFSESTQMNH